MPDKSDNKPASNLSKSFPYKTRGRGKKAKSFRIEISEDSLVLINEKNTEFEFTFNDLNKLLMELWELFEMKWFPLANNYSKVFEGSEKDGLGKTMYSIWRNSRMIQAASYLGVYLEKVGVFTFPEMDWQKRVVRRITWKLSEDPVKVNVKEVLLAYGEKKS